MRERQASLADGLMEARALLDGRYRLDALIRRSKIATIHAATHRNGASAWLKLPISSAHADAIALEARIANAIGSALSVRDDGVTREGLPYLVLDPPDGESFASLRARARAGARLSVARTMRAGEALAGVVSALHGMGYVTAGLDDEDILVFANDDIALLDLHAASPATPAGIRADNARVVRVMSALIEDTDALPASISAAVANALVGQYADASVLQAAWRFAFPASIKSMKAVPSAGPPSSSRKLDAAPLLPVHDTPLVVTVAKEPSTAEPDSSMVEYLRSGSVDPSVASVRGPQERPVMYDPLSRLAEMPRLVQATSRRPEEGARATRGRGFVAAVVAAPLLVMAVGVSLLVSSAGPPPRAMAGGANAVSLPLPKEAHAGASPVAAPPSAPSAPSAAPDETFELPDESPASAVAPVAVVPSTDVPPEGGTAVLRTDAAPAGRPVYLDGKIVGDTPLEATVPCGRHALQMVAGARPQVINLPCGGERVIRYTRAGHWSVK